MLSCCVSEGVVGEERVEEGCEALELISVPAHYQIMISSIETQEAAVERQRVVEREDEGSEALEPHQSTG